MKRPQGGAGRERGRSENRPHRVAVQVDDATMAALDREAERRGWTVSRTAAEMLKDVIFGAAPVVVHLAGRVIGDSQSGPRRTVADWVRAAGGEDPAGPEANRVLGSHGMKIVPGELPGGSGGYLIVANDHPSLAALFNGSPWAGKIGTMGAWVEAFRVLPGAERSKTTYFAGAISKGTCIPLNLIPLR